MRGVDVSNGELKPARARRGGVMAAACVLTIGVAGVAWSGCGSSGNAKSVEEKVQSGINQAEKTAEKGFEEAQKGLKNKNKAASETLEKAEEATKEGLKKGKETAKQVTEEVEKAQSEYKTP
jgi:flagellar hook-basal body complex protein FliE